MVLLKPVVEATSNIVFDPATYHEPHTLGRPLALMGNAFITCKILSAERVNHGAYSLFELRGCQVGAPYIAVYSPEPVLKVNTSFLQLKQRICVVVDPLSTQCLRVRNALPDRRAGPADDTS
jgi:hypothetical protein